MATKNVNTRIVNKHDIEANWLKATTFIPMQGEIIIYDIEVDEDGNTLELPEGRTTPYTYERIKIGDGKKLVKDLPFYGNGVYATFNHDHDDDYIGQDELNAAVSSAIENVFVWDEDTFTLSINTEKTEN